MKYIINQPAGLGDILFCQKIGASLPGQTTWPISDQYEYIPEYIKCENIKFVSIKDISPELKNLIDSPISKIQQVYIDKEEFSYIPLTNSYRSIPNTIMESKYDFVNMNYDGWANHFNIIRNLDREDNLIKSLSIDLSTNYNLINSTFGTYPNYLNYDKPMRIFNDYKNIEMEFLGFDRLFDWIPIIENASEIHTVNTSIVYLIENLNFKGKLFMYNRNDVSYTKFYSKKMYSLNWNYIPYD
jgi:hypothetical protein